MKHIKYIILFFFAIMISFFLKVNGVNAQGSFAGNYYCYRGGTLLSTTEINQTIGSDLYVKCPSGWTNVNFYLKTYNLGTTVPDGNSRVFSAIPSSPIGFISGYNLEGNNDKCLISSSRIICPTTQKNGSYGFYLTGDGSTNWKVLKFFTFATDNDISILSNFQATGNIENSINSNINSLKEQQAEEVEVEKGIWGTIKSIFQTITNIPGLIWNSIKGGFEAITNAISNIVNSVGKFFENLLSGILDGIKNLFIPKDMSFISDFVESIEIKLGFIAEIPMKVIMFTLNLVNATWTDFHSISFPSVSIFGFQFWDSSEIDLTDAINIFKPFKYVTDVICVTLFCTTLLRWWEQFTGGSK